MGAKQGCHSIATQGEPRERGSEVCNVEGSFATGRISPPSLKCPGALALAPQTSTYPGPAKSHSGFPRLHGRIGEVGGPWMLRPSSSLTQPCDLRQDCSNISSLWLSGSLAQLLSDILDISASLTLCISPNLPLALLPSSPHCSIVRTSLQLAVRRLDPCCLRLA